MEIKDANRLMITIWQMDERLKDVKRNLEGITQDIAEIEDTIADSMDSDDCL